MSELRKVKMFVEPVGLHSRAMTRVANAIKRYAPPNIVFVNSAEEADIQVLHVIDWCDEFLNWPRSYIAIQYCLETTSCKSVVDWSGFWAKSILTWSYYDLGRYMERVPAIPCSERLFRAPLGADQVFQEHARQLLCRPHSLRVHGSGQRNLIVTSGYVSGPGAEAIEEVWSAAERTGWAGVHIGPSKVEGVRRCGLPADWRSVVGCTDAELAWYYRNAYFVAGMRYVEGFELPAVESLLCGSQPLVFDQASQKHWYGDLVQDMVPEKQSPRHRSLSAYLEEKFSEAKYFLVANGAHSDSILTCPQNVAKASARFNWASIIPDMFEAAGL